MFNPQYVVIQARTSLLHKTLAVSRSGATGCCVLRSSSSKFVALGISQRFVLSLTPFGDQPRPGELVPNPLPGRLLGARWQRARRSHPQKDPGQPGNSNCFAIREISGGAFSKSEKVFSKTKTAFTKIAQRTKQYKHPRGPDLLNENGNLLNDPLEKSNAGPLGARKQIL